MKKLTIVFSSILLLVACTEDNEEGNIEDSLAQVSSEEEQEVPPVDVESSASAEEENEVQEETSSSSNSNEPTENFSQDNSIFMEADREFEEFLEEIEIHDWQSLEAAQENSELRDERDSDEKLEHLSIRAGMSTIYVSYQLSPSNWEEELMAIGSRRMNHLLDLTNHFEGYDGDDEYFRLIVRYQLGQRSVDEDVISIDYYYETGELIYHDQQSILGY